MKVLLINPYPQNQKLTKSWREFESVNIPLGLCYIASYLKEFNIDIEILDCYAQRIDLDGTIKKVTLASPDLIGISCTTPSFSVVKEIAETIKEKAADVPVVVGGHHPTALPEDTLKFSCFDYVVRGEGEETALDLVRYLNREIDIDDIAGLSYRKNGNIINNIDREPIKDLDSLPYPAVDLLNLNLYKDPPHWQIAKASFNIIGSRGCVFNCSFCSHKFMGNGRRCRSVKNIIGEIKYLVERYKARQINFVDPIFPLNEREGLEFCEEMSAAGLDGEILWLCETNVNSITDKLLKNMRKCGCRKIIFGIENCNENILKNIGKNYTKQDIRNAIKMTNDAGIETIGLFIIGFPGETKEMIEETIKFSVSIGLSYAKYNLLVPYPGTEIYEQIKTQNGNSLPANWGDYIPYPFLANEAKAYKPDKITSKEFNKLQQKAYFSFYSQPRILWQQLRKSNIRQTF